VKKGPETIADLGAGVPNESELEPSGGVPHGLGGASEVGGVSLGEGASRFSREGLANAKLRLVLAENATRFHSCYTGYAMTDAAKKLLDAASALPEDERLALASELIASVDGPPDSDWESAWLAELDRRVEAARERGETAPEWSEVRARVLSQLGR